VKYKVVPWQKSTDNMRYIIVDDSTGEIMCDANGHGYKTMQSASKALAYKLKNGWN